MDMMRTLLIYLSASMAFAVQSTSAPQETPTPSPVPTAVVETMAPQGEDTAEAVTPAPAETEAPAPEAEATERPTPAAVPTITPNMKGYHNLAMGAKGKDVKRLQEKLIEMKYLPEGAADGAYGRQTYNAIRKFQYYNGLRQDGIAGRSTQTNLFENSEVVQNPEWKGETPAPQETPASSPEAEATERPAEAEGTAPEGENTEAELTAVPPELADQYLKDLEQASAAETAEEPNAETVEEETREEAPQDQVYAVITAAENLEEVTEQTAEPETPEPTTEPTPTPTMEPIPTAEPETPEPTAEPELTAEPEEAPDEIIENVDLDADVYDLIPGSVALNEGDGPLEFVTMEDGVPVTAKPRLAQNGAKIRVSLDDLCQCVEDWRLTDDGVGTIVLEAAGYTLAIYNEESGCSASVDGTEIPMKEDDLDFSGEGHFINAEFLAEALRGDSAWDPEESTLMLRIPEKADEEIRD